MAGSAACCEIVLLRPWHVLTAPRVSEHTFEGSTCCPCEVGQAVTLARSSTVTSLAMGHAEFRPGLVSCIRQSEDWTLLKTSICSMSYEWRAQPLCRADSNTCQYGVLCMWIVMAVSHFLCGSCMHGMHAIRDERVVIGMALLLRTQNLSSFGEMIRTKHDGPQESASSQIEAGVGKGSLTRGSHLVTTQLMHGLRGFGHGDQLLTPPSR